MDDILASRCIEYSSYLNVVIMRGLCLSVSPDGAVFQIDGEQPVPGLYYELEDATTGTGAQNRAFHSLLNAFFFWMQRTGNFQFEDGGVVYDLSVTSVGDFREYFKFKYGEGASHYQYVNESFQMVKVKTIDEIPQYAVDDFNAGNKGRVKAVIKSWTDYTLKQRKKAIDQLFMLIFASGCDDKKVHEIIDGMQTNEEKIREVFK